MVPTTHTTMAAYGSTTSRSRSRGNGMSAYGGVGREDAGNQVRVRIRAHGQRGVQLPERGRDDSTKLRTPRVLQPIEQHQHRGEMIRQLVPLGDSEFAELGPQPREQRAALVRLPEQVPPEIERARGIEIEGVHVQLLQPLDGQSLDPAR